MQKKKNPIFKQELEKMRITPLQMGPERDGDGWEKKLQNSETE